MSKFSLNLIALRRKRNLTLVELANQLNKKYDVKFSKASIDRWEKDQTSPSVTHASALAHFFGVSLDELSGREELDLQKPQTLAAHLEGELKQEDIDYIMSLVERFKNEDK
ncbi:helix-turn-helix transcriptional regulator [Staphylococcus chromogenes]|uniref:helix-turn-helix domain-containing protein n=1 Tax=Staphylococcus chromogenes TaxID=46126 RepID=UPI003B001412